MSILKIAGCGAAATLASLISIGSTQAAMAPAVNAGNLTIQHVDCAVGFHLGPAGACILGTDNDRPPPPTLAAYLPSFTGEGFSRPLNGGNGASR